MPIIAAPLEAVAVLGMHLSSTFFSIHALRGGNLSLVFILAGVPVYYITHRNDQDIPRILGEYLATDTYFIAQNSPLLLLLQVGLNL